MRRKLDKNIVRCYNRKNKQATQRCPYKCKRKVLGNGDVNGYGVEFPVRSVMIKQMISYRKDIRREVQKVSTTDGRVNYFLLAGLFFGESMGEMFICGD